MIEQQSRGVNNINLVTPTMYVYQIIEAIKIARKNGLKIPIIYNTNSYENVSTIRALNGYIDVYLPDLKYYSDEIAIKYSKAPNYFKVSTEAIKEMYKQVGEPIFDENGIIKKGVIIRHLILPNHIQNTEHILKWIKDTFDNKVYVSVMAQYFPTYKAKNDDKLNRKISTRELKMVICKTWENMKKSLFLCLILKMCNVICNSEITLIITIILQDTVIIVTIM